MQFTRAVLLSATVLFLIDAPLSAGTAIQSQSKPAANDAAFEALLFPEVNVEGLRSRGREVLPALARLYERSDEPRRAVIAYAFYVLGWKSPEAKRVLLADIHTANQDLRLQVQWAIGRVSSDVDVVDVLLENMQNDKNPLFRDKAACALAHDQIHLTEQQKIHLFERLIRALRDPKPDVRDIAAKVLQIQTGQTKGFDPNAAEPAREAVVRVWERWLDTYRANL